MGSSILWEGYAMASTLHNHFAQDGPGHQQDAGEN